MSQTASPVALPQRRYLPWSVANPRLYWRLGDSARGARQTAYEVLVSTAPAVSGGDQWDNPRYRAIFLLWQALLAAYAWGWWRRTHNVWQGRVLAVEGEFLLFFGYWYIARYTHWKAGQVHIFVIFALIAVVGVVIFVGGWLWDRRKNNFTRPR